VPAATLLHHGGLGPLQRYWFSPSSLWPSNEVCLKLSCPLHPKLVFSVRLTLLQADFALLSCSRSRIRRRSRLLRLFEVSPTLHAPTLTTALRVVAFAHTVYIESAIANCFELASAVNKKCSPSVLVHQACQTNPSAETVRQRGRRPTAASVQHVGKASRLVVIHQIMC